MAEVGTYYITIMPEMSHFTGEVNSALKAAGTSSGKKYSRTFSDVLKGSAIGTALGGLAQRAGRSIMDGMDVGIKRLDTLKNYPKVMEALGYSTDDADRSIKTIMQHLDGLPSSTQDLVTLTQAISDSTGDLDLATAAALGFNDMLLANGASAAEVATAQGVLNRVLGKGSATAAQWQSLTSVMPAQLGMVAKAMLGSTASTEDLHAALEDGTVSWNDFLKAIAELDQSGYIDENGKKLASFEQQARTNSHGIGTAIENVKNRIGAGWASIFDAVGQEAISGTIDKMSYGVKNAMQRVADAIGWLKDQIAGTQIGESLQGIADGIGSVVGSLWTDADTETVKGMATALVDLVDGALQWLADNGELVGVALTSMVGPLAVMAGIQLGNGILALPGLLQALNAALMANAFVLIASAIAAVVVGLTVFFTKTEAGRRIWKNFCDSMKNLWNGLKADFQNMVNTIKQNIEASNLVWENFKNSVRQKVEEIKQGVTDKFNAIKKAVSDYSKQAKDDFIKNWNDSKKKVSELNEQIRQNVSSKWTSIRTTISEKLTAIKTAASNAWNNIKTTASNAWSAVKSTITSAWNGIKSSVSGALGSLSGTISNTWNGIKNTISGVVGTIRSLLNFSWSIPKPSIPHIPLPHFSITGKFSLNPPSMPKVSVSWYKQGGIFDSASIIGVGEAGPEAVLPLNRQSYYEIARGIGSQMGSGVVVSGNTFVVREEADIDRIADALSRKIRRERMAMA